MDGIGGKIHGIQSTIVDVMNLNENFEHVPEGTAFMPNGEIVASEGAMADLAYFRSLFPFMPIMPIPNNVASVVCAVANQPYDLTFPDGTQLVHFAADGTDYFVSFDGAAKVPTAADISTYTQNKMAMFRPDYTWFYVAGTRQVSVISTTAGRIIQAHSYIVSVRPK